MKDDEDYHEAKKHEIDGISQVCMFIFPMKLDYYSSRFYKLMYWLISSIDIFNSLHIYPSDFVKGNDEIIWKLSEEKNSSEMKEITAK